MMRSIAVASASAVLAVALFAGASAARADYAAGQRAWEESRYAAARSEWLAAAEAGDARAMLALGRMYREGLGALQDFVEAHKWFNLAASRGESAAVKERDGLTARMTAQQVAEAQVRAASWQPGAATAVPGAAPAAAVPPPPSAGDAGPPPPRAIREARQLLEALGYAPGPSDGEWGPRTAAAHAAFLRDAGLPPAASLTPRTLRAMRAAAEARGLQAGMSGMSGTSGSAAAATSGAGAPPPPDILHRAVLARDVEGLETALAAGADVDRRDARGMTALMHAADKGYPVLAELLLGVKADLNVRAPDGATALFMAVARGHVEVVAQLMRAGAEVSIKGPKDMTAVDMARLTQGDAGEGGVAPEMRALLWGLTWAAFEAVPSVGTVFRDCEECPEMVVVPPGEFMMGSPRSERGRFDNEGPMHRVRIERPFAVGVYEVTFAEWDACESGGGCGGYRPDDGGWGRGRRPVIGVSWEDAQSYVRWLSEKTGEAYRLPSESEWEYVARAGTGTPFHTGETVSAEQANHDGRYNYDGSYVGGGGLYRGEPIAAGSFEANGFGLHDVHGNVWEWVGDCWNDSYLGAPENGSAWESGDCRQRVQRGGSWNNRLWNLRSANRDRDDTGLRYNNVGFRVARTLAP